MRSIPENLQAVMQRVAEAARAAGRDPGAVALLAVSKTHAPALIEQAFGAGQRAFGENYVQEAVEKMDALPRLPIEWHLVGPLQSNKTRLVAERFRELRELYESLKRSGLTLDTLSMGMSADMEAAIAEGSTMVRIGTAIFGQRQRVKDAA